MKKLFLLILPILAMSFNACDSTDDGDNGSPAGSNATGSIKVVNGYTHTVATFGVISSVAIIDSDGKYVKTSSKSIDKGSSATFSDIPAGVYKVNIMTRDSYGPKPVTKTNVSVSSGGTTTVTFK